jgi:type IV pilus assembly protein PilO
MNEWIEDLLDKPLQQKILYLTGASIVIWFVLWTVLLGGQWSRLSQLSEELGNDRERLASMQAKAANLEAVRAQVSELDRELSAALARLPDRKEIPNLLNNLSELANASGLRITKFRQLDELPRDYYAEVPVELSMQGSFHQVAAFFSRVPRLSRLINMSSISMKRPAVFGDAVQVDASCLATTFRFLDEEERAKNAKEKASKNSKSGKRT